MSNHPKRSQSIRFAVIQNGYCVFGAGHTEAQAIADACQWLEGHSDGEGVPYTPRVLRAELDANRISPVDGDLVLIDVDDDDFSSYLKNQGGFEFRRGKWFMA